MKIHQSVLLILLFPCFVRGMQQLPFLMRIPQSITIPTRWHKIHVPPTVKVHALNQILRIEHLFLDRLILEHDLCTMESHLIWPKIPSLTSVRFSEELYRDIIFPWTEYPAERFTPLVNALKNEANTIEFTDGKNNVVHAWVASQFPLHIAHKALNIYINQNKRYAEKMYTPWDVGHAERQAYQMLVSDVEKCARQYYDNVAIDVLKKSDTSENCLIACAQYHAKQSELVRLKAAIYTSESQLLALINHKKNHNEDL